MTIFYLDLETSNLQGTTLIQIGCISDKFDIFNCFCTPPSFTPFPEHCTELTGFYNYKGRLFQHGTELDCYSRRESLQNFLKYLEKYSDGSVHLVAHNGFGFDYRVLLRHFRQCNISFSDGIKLCDSLPAVKQFFKLNPNKQPESSSGYSLNTLAEIYKIGNNCAHNALADAITLKRICDFLIFDHNLPSDYFISKQKNTSDFLK